MKNFLGFTSPHDFFAGIFTDIKKYQYMNIFAFASFLSLFIVFFIEQWVWSPIWSLMIFTAVFTVDFILAVMVSVKKVDVGGGFQTNKAVRFILSLLVSWCILGIAHNMSALNAEFGAGMVESKVFSMFATVIYMSWLLFNFMSVIRHASVLGFVPKPIAAFFIKYIDAHKNIISKAQPQEEQGAQEEPTQYK